MKTYHYNPNQHILLGTDFTSAKPFSLSGKIDYRKNEEVFLVHDCKPGSWWSMALAFAFRGKSLRQEIASLPKAEASKLFSNKRYLISPDWSSICFSSVRLITRIKAHNDIECAQALIKSQQDKKIFIQQAHGDQFWGAQANGNVYVGENYVGRLWTELAKDMVKSHQATPSIVFNGIEKLNLSEAFFTKIGKSNFKLDNSQQDETMLQC